MTTETMRFGYTKKEWSWIFYDWANSAYSLMITTAIFPIVYNGLAESQGVSAADSTAYLGYANSFATLLVGLVAPVLGAMADYKGYRQKMFTTAALLGMLAVVGIALLPQDQPMAWAWMLGIYIISVLGFSGANVFYDAALIDVTTPARMSNVSSTGFAMGYLGSNIPFIIFIIILTSAGSLGLAANTVITFGFLLTAVWWFVFTIPYWKNVDQRTWIEPESQPIRKAFRRLGSTLSNARQHKNMFLFLLAYFLYIDGVGTIIKMATSVGSDFGIDANALIILLLFIQFVAFPFSILYGRLAGKFGEKPMILVGIATYIVICILALIMTETWHFYLLGFLVGTAQGGIQSLSRSFYGKLIPAERHNEYFGIYNIFGKFSSILGTTLLGITAQITGDSLTGVFSILALFLIGGVLFLFVKVPEEAPADVTGIE